MSNVVPVGRDFSQDQIALIRKTIAPSASAQEFDLFIYRCKHMDLDPLKPGQIHFVKYGQSPGAIIVGIEGFRVRAAKTGKHSGTKRGVLRDESGRCVGAWCEIYRSDWTHPAREEVSLGEYNTGKAQWAKMPETMIKKVAECAALRMAFPDELGGLYSNEEMDQAEPRDVSPPQEQPKETSKPKPITATIQARDWRVTFGTTEKGYRSMTLGDAIERDGLPKVQLYINRLIESCDREKKPVPYQYAEFRDRLNEIASSTVQEEPDLEAAFEAGKPAHYVRKPIRINGVKLEEFEVEGQDSTFVYVDGRKFNGTYEEALTIARTGGK